MAEEALGTSFKRLCAHYSRMRCWRILSGLRGARPNKIVCRIRRLRRIRPILRLRFPRHSRVVFIFGGGNPRRAKQRQTGEEVEKVISPPTQNISSLHRIEQAKSKVALKDHINQYNKELYNKVWLFLDGYITSTLTPFYTENDINIIKHSTFEFFINDQRSISLTNRVAIPEYLSMQDIAHFFHNLSELMSYYKKLKQIDYFKYITYFMNLKDYDSQSLYGNSTRISGSSIIPLYRIADSNNPISEFVKKIKKEMPHNQRIIS